MTLLDLRTERLALTLAPSAGGSIARFTVDGMDIMRPMTATDIASGKGNNAASYPLVPFAGRIGDGRLLFQGETIRLAPQSGNCGSSGRGRSRQRMLKPYGALQRPSRPLGATPRTRA